MGKSKKEKRKNTPQNILNMRAKAAGGAAATAGRSRVFDNKKDFLAKDTGDAEIDEGLAEYKEKSNAQSVFQDFFPACADYETFRTELGKLPPTMYPDLIRAMVVAAYEKQVFKPSGASTFVTKVESEMKK